MQVILLDNIKNLGRLGDKVKVKPGFGRNYLIPQKKAAFATTKNLEMFEARRAEFELKAAETLKTAQERAAAFEGKKFTLMAKASEEGKLYGSVGTREISRAAHAQGLKLEASEVILNDGVIRVLGEYNVTLALHNDVKVPVVIEVVAE